LQLATPVGIVVHIGLLALRFYLLIQEVGTNFHSQVVDMELVVAYKLSTDGLTSSKFAAPAGDTAASTTPEGAAIKIGPAIAFSVVGIVAMLI
jgi:hypothetical protein